MPLFYKGSKIHAPTTIRVGEREVRVKINNGYQIYVFIPYEVGGSAGEGLGTSNPAEALELLSTTLGSLYDFSDHQPRKIPPERWDLEP